MYINTQTNQYPVTERDIRNLNPNTSFPSPFVAPDEYAVVFPAPQPTHDPIIQAVREIAPVLTNKGHYEQAYEIVQLDAEAVVANQAAKDATDAKTIADKIDALWCAADSYVSGYISGVAIGILTIGVIQNKSKCLAVTAWSSAVWGTYYSRKALVTAMSVDDLDFSGLGSMPYSVPELHAELGM